MQEMDRKGWMTRSGRGRNARGGKESMDDPKWERRKECKRMKGKDGWPEVGEEEGMQEMDRKGWMTLSGRGGKEGMDDPKWERRKECKRMKGKDGWPKVGEEEGMQKDERKGWMTQSCKGGRI